MLFTTNKYYLKLEKTENGISLKIELEGNTFLPLIREAYDKWNIMLDGKLGQHLGMPQIEHRSEQQSAPKPVTPKAPSGIQELHKEAGMPSPDLDFDDKIPF